MNPHFTVVVPAVLWLAAGGDHPFETESDRAVAFQTGGRCLVRNATIHSAVSPAFVGDVLVIDGDIAAIGSGLTAPDGVLVIDATGMHLAPGVIDCHSHMAIEGGVNEGTLAITADCDITDAIDEDDLALYRALAGGVTAVQCLHGSANPIGGRSELLKLRWGEDLTADELRFEDAPQGIKFALGENVKRSSGRFPGTRMGTEAVFYRAFERAREYQREWTEFDAARARGEDPPPPRRDVRLDVLAGILEGEVKVHSHCYTQSEIIMLLRVAERFGFRIQTLQHVLEGYKVAAEIAAHGAGASTFSDWWAYKVEAYDAIPHNAALLDEAGAVTTVNSDSEELVRHLYHEAAKSVRYAFMDPVRALRLVTLNAAIQLGVDERTGSIEVGKDADLVLLTHEPLSVYSVVQWTMVDGVIEFTRRDAFGFEDSPADTRVLVEPSWVEASWTPKHGDLLAVVGATVHPVTSPAIEHGTVLIQGDLIVAVGGPELAVPKEATLVDASGKHVWPGVIALNSSLGLHEIGAVDVTNDSSERGGNQPDVRVSASINPDSAHIGVSRSAGITRAQTAPQGGGPITGQSAVIDLDGSTWEELMTVDRDMLHVEFPGVSEDQMKSWVEKRKVPQALEELADLFEEAREYDRLVREAAGSGAKSPAYDRRLEELAPYAIGERRVGLHVNEAQSILAAIRFLEDREIDAVLFGLRDGWKVAQAVARSGLPVVVGPVLAVPRSEYDPCDACYANAAALHRAGVKVALMVDDADNTRNLPFHAGFAVAYGLPYDEGLRAITLYAAEVLGLEDQLGSLARGKRADLVISDGDLLDVTTHVERVFIDGIEIDRRNRQSDLFEKFHERLHRVQER